MIEIDDRVRRPERSIDYRETDIELAPQEHDQSPDAFVSWSFALVQNGTVYRSDFGRRITTAWTTNGFDAMTATDFLSGAGTHPDFWQQALRFNSVARYQILTRSALATNRRWPGATPNAS